MSCYKELLCEVEELQAQLSEVEMAIEGLIELITESGGRVSARDVILQLSGVQTEPVTSKPTMSYPRFDQLRLPTRIARPDTN